MPFTVSHIAAVLPLRHRLPLAALAIGAMVPDFTYVIEVFGPSLHGHTIPGLFLFCLPAGLAAWIIFERWLRDPWTETFPWLARTEPLTSPFVAGVAVFIGAITHVFWDGFTHRGGFAVEQLEDLSATMFLVGGRSYEVFRVLQHWSTLFGAAVVLWFVNERMQATGRPFVTSVVRLTWLAGLLVVTTLLISLPWLLGPAVRGATIEGGLVRIAFRMLAAATVLAVFGPWILRRLA